MDFQFKSFFWEFKGKVNYVDQWLLMRTPYPMLMILAAYLIIVLKVGPNYMKNRKPFDLKSAIITYNIFQIIFSFYGFFQAVSYLYQYGLFFATCNLEKEENLYQITSLTHLCFMSRFSDLFDTVFFVLRKKQRQITFLHVYHHVSMVIIMWVIAKYDPNENCVFLGALNTFVHTIMYTYYCLSAIPSILQYLWWKKYLTSLQLVQFVLGLVYVTVSFFITPCLFSRVVLNMIYGNGFIFLYLFGKFYIESYSKNKNSVNKKR